MPGPRTRLNKPLSRIAFWALILTGCDPKFYIPNTQNVPIIRAKGQSNLTVAGNGNQFEFQGAYGISDDLALQASGGFISPKNEDNGDGGSGKFIEAGLGYYRNLNPNLLVDAYGLIGFGTMENHFPNTLTSNPNTTGKIMANLTRFGIQPGISYHRNYFSISGSANDCLKRSRPNRLSCHRVTAPQASERSRNCEAIRAPGSPGSHPSSRQRGRWR